MDCWAHTMCVSKEFPGDADAAGLGATLWEPLLTLYAHHRALSPPWGVWFTPDPLTPCIASDKTTHNKYASIGTDQMKWDISVISDWSLDSDYEFPKPDGLLEKLGWHSPNPALACCWTHLQAQNLRPDGCPGCWPSCSCPAQNLAWCRRSCGGKPSFSLGAPACSLETTVGLAHKLLGSCHTQRVHDLGLWFPNLLRSKVQLHIHTAEDNIVWI